MELEAQVDLWLKKKNKHQKLSISPKLQRSIMDLYILIIKNYKKL